jgi:Icc-related predicted phosphoesterase
VSERIRIAAAGDVHASEAVRERVEAAFARLDAVDLVLLAGDLTTHGEPDQAVVIADAARLVDCPVVAVLGNHDHHAGEEQAVVGELERGGVCVLEGTAVTFTVDGVSVGIAGTKGFGGGFTGASGSEFGEVEMKDFLRHAREVSERFGVALDGLSTDVRIALTHYSPVRDTLRGEPPEIYPFLGTYLLAEVIDRAGADLAVHGHAHRGREHGLTDGGVPVRNVAEPVLMAPYRVYGLEPAGSAAAAGSAPTDAA